MTHNEDDSMRETRKQENLATTVCRYVCLSHATLYSWFCGFPGKAGNAVPIIVVWILAKSRKPSTPSLLLALAEDGNGERDWPFVKVIDNKHLLEQLELGNSYHNHKEIHQDEIATLHVADVCQVGFFREGEGVDGKQ